MMRENGEKRIGNRMLRRALRTVVLLYILLAGLVWLFQDWLIFHPTRGLEATPAEFGLAYEDVWLEPVGAGEGERVHGWYIPAPGGMGTVLFCHGNARNIATRLDMARLINSLGYDVFLFDYRGFGLSGGRPSEANIRADTRAAWGYLTETRGLAPEHIIVHGHSLGGAAASGLAAEVFPAGLVMEAAFTSLPDMAARQLPGLPARWLCKYDFNNLANLQKVNCPVMFAHSREDELIPFGQGRRLYEAYGNNEKNFFELRGAHNFGAIQSGEAYRQALGLFYDKVITGAVSVSANPTNIVKPSDVTAGIDTSAGANAVGGRTAAQPAAHPVKVE